MLKAIIRTNPIAPRITIQERMVKSAGYSSKIRIKLENMRRTSHFLFLCVLPTHGRFITFIASQGKPTTVFPSTHCFSLFMQRLNSSDSRCSPTRTKHPYVQFTRLQRLSVGLSQRYGRTHVTTCDYFALAKHTLSAQLETCSDVIMRSTTTAKHVLSDGIDEEQHQEEKNGSVCDAPQKNSPGIHFRIK